MKISKAERRKLLTHDRVTSLVTYDSDTGEFYWKVDRNSYAKRVKAGDVVKGSPNVWGYKTIGIDGVQYQAHRLAWFYVHGSWPIGEIDHINLNINDNRLCNLRDAPKRFQRGNQRVRKDSSSGVKGVRWHKRRNKWQARCCSRSLGYFDHIEDAKRAYRSAAEQEFGEFARFE